MQTQIFVNLAVKNLRKSIIFFTNLGYTFNPKFTTDTSTCIIISDTIFVMLLEEDVFKKFTKKPLADAFKSTEVIICISVDSKVTVDEMVKLALAEGGTSANQKQDHGFMYAHSFEDLDGHLWEVMWLNPDADL
ncbi:MAG: hypothetical protein LH615_13405 [Ferruginibacter sp.]|nr:hypothetical protein [Ferruginibacter sp.]